MKKYKLIKKYPGCGKLGTIYTSQWVNAHFFKEFPEYWEEIIEKDFEVMSFYFYGKIYKKTGATNQHYLTKKIYNVFLTENKDGILTDEDLENKKYDENHYIHSVKRLSDGEIFTVGDNYQFGAIPGFYIQNNKIYIKRKECYPSLPLSMAEKVKKPLFKTADGVDIYEGDKVWGIATDVWTPFYQNVRDNPPNKAVTEKWVYGKFSTKEAAEEFILFNKPNLSLNDVFSVYPKYKKDGVTLTNHALELIQKQKF